MLNLRVKCDILSQDFLLEGWPRGCKTFFHAHLKRSMLSNTQMYLTC